MPPCVDRGVFRSSRVTALSWSFTWRLTALSPSPYDDFISQSLGGRCADSVHKTFLGRNDIPIKEDSERFQCKYTQLINVSILRLRSLNHSHTGVLHGDPAVSLSNVKCQGTRSWVSYSVVPTQWHLHLSRRSEKHVVETEWGRRDSAVRKIIFSYLVTFKIGFIDKLKQDG